MHTSGSRYRTLLGNRAFVALLASSVLARLPLGTNSLAILLFLRVRTGSFLTAGIALGAYTLSFGAAAPIQGMLLDRLEHRRLLLICAATETVLMGALVLATDAALPHAVLIAIAAMTGATSPPVSASARTLWPRVLAGGGTLEAAFALDATTQELIWTLGPLIVGVSVALFSAQGAMLVCVAIGVLGALLIGAVPAFRERRPRGAHRAPRSGAIRSRALRALFASVTILGVMMGAFEVGLPALAVHLRAPSSSGALLALVSAGSMIGGVLYGARSWRVSMRARHEIALLAASLLALPLLLLARSLPAAIVLSLLAGVTCAPVLSCQYALVNALAPDGSVAEAFTWHTAALVAGAAAGSALSGVLVEAAGFEGPLAMACLAPVAAAMVAIAKRKAIVSAPSVKPAGAATSLP